MRLEWPRAATNGVRSVWWFPFGSRCRRGLARQSTEVDQSRRPLPGVICHAGWVERVRRVRMSLEGSRRHWTPATYGACTPKALSASTRNIPSIPTKFIFRAQVAHLRSAKATTDGPAACRSRRCSCGGIATRVFCFKRIDYRPSVG